MPNKLLVPSELRQKIHGKYIDNKYKGGITIFKTIDDDTVDLVLDSFLEWCFENKRIDGTKVDLAGLIKDK